MGVSELVDQETEVLPRGPKARTRRLMLDTATRMMQAGETPSVSAVAAAAGVSRATAYRTFPSQAALVGAVVDEGLGPILSWSSDSMDAEERVTDLLETSMPRILEFEATFKAALRLTLQQWAERQSGANDSEVPFRRGHRVVLLQQAIAPLKAKLPRAQFGRLAKALSLVYGLEVLIILKDIWGLKPAEAENIATWAGRSLVRAAVAEAASAETKARIGKGAG